MNLHIWSDGEPPAPETWIVVVVPVAFWSRICIIKVDELKRTLKVFDFVSPIEWHIIHKLKPPVAFGIHIKITVAFCPNPIGFIVMFLPVVLKVKNPCIPPEFVKSSSKDILGHLSLGSKDNGEQEP